VATLVEWLLSALLDRRVTRFRQRAALGELSGASLCRSAPVQICEFGAILGTEQISPDWHTRQRWVARLANLEDDLSHGVSDPVKR
jgi:hypothetical protein